MSTSCLLFYLLLVEIPVLAMSCPTPMIHHKDGLRRLYQQMCQLKNRVQGVVHHLDTSFPIVSSLTSLPTINIKPKDLAKVKANSTLPQLSSDLHTFKLHFDWLLYWHNDSDSVSSESQEIANKIQSIIILVQNETDSPVQQPFHNLPPLKSAWDRKWTSAVIHKRLLDFCNFYLRVLRLLMYTHNGHKQGRQHS